MMKRFAVFLILYITLILCAFSQQFNFSNYSLNEGLSQSVVNCLFQDSKGYLWIGTQNGLNRFDGESFEVYRFIPDDSASISNNWIFSIAEDRDSNLWISTKGGLNKYLPSTNVFEKINVHSESQNSLSRLSYDNIGLRNGNILINSPPNISIFDFEKDTFLQYNSNTEFEGTVNDVKIPVFENTDGTIWTGTTKGLFVFSFLTKEFSRIPFYTSKNEFIEALNITMLFQDSQNKMWAGTTNGIFCFNAEKKACYEYLFPMKNNGQFKIDGNVRTMTEDKNNNFFIGTEGNGLFQVTPVKDGFYTIQNYTSQNSALGHNIVQSLLIDKSENLWIGTLSGISKADLKKRKFRLFRNNNTPNSINLLGNVIAGLYKNDDGIIWVGNWGQGLNLVNPHTREVEHFSSDLSGNHFIPNNFVHVIFKDDEKNIWIGTRDGIYIYDKPANRFVDWLEYFGNPTLPSFKNIRIYQIIQDHVSNFWIATSNGLYKVDLKKGLVDAFRFESGSNRHISDNNVYDILEDSDGLIWIATINGLDVYNPRTGNLKHFKNEKKGLSSNFVISLYEDSQKRIWIGTNSYINIYDKEKSEFTYFSENEGLPSNYIYEIVEDRNGNLWFATGNGLCCLNTKNNAIEIFSEEDGLQSLEFNLRAAFACNDGELLFGGMNGFNTVYPDSIAGNPYKPNVVFTSIYKQTGNAREFVYSRGIKKLVFNHKVTSFTIEFAALEFTNPEKNQYAYKMEGISDNWENIGNRKFVPFFALPPGEYVFYVKGSNNDGLWNDQGISIQIEVLPPWWRSNYAWFVYMLMLFSAIVIFIQLRERKLKSDKLVLEQKVAERTLQIKEQNQVITSKNQELNELNKTKDKFFSIIGHDLGNHFNIIIGFAEVLLSGFRNMNNNEQELHLTNIYKSSVSAHDLLGNLLTWARLQRNAILYQPEKVNAGTKIRKLLAFHEEAALKKNIIIEVCADEELFIFVDENMFSTIVRNLVANAIKFTNTDGEISIRLSKETNTCKIQVKDSGVGIPPENRSKIFRIDSSVRTKGTDGEKGTGLGLILCKEFVEKHGGTIWVNSEPGKGSEFIFTMPLWNPSQL